jgi:Cys-tRNA(Pro)/Cys-tRNA(Cys) deacylase
MAKKMEKTNVMRLLEQKKVPYESYCYVDAATTVGTEVADVLGQDPNRVFKTLVTVGGKTKQNFVFVIPVNKELDLKKAARAAGDKNMEMVAVKELLNLTGYIRGGCSPVGMKKKYPTYLDETCVLWEEIAVSAGARGHQMILPPEELATLVNAKLADITL